MYINFIDTHIFSIECVLDLRDEGSRGRSVVRVY